MGVLSPLAECAGTTGKTRASRVSPAGEAGYIGPVRATMRTSAVLICAVVLASTAGCDLPWIGDNHVRTVLVDYHHDQFAAVFGGYYPKQVTVRAGDTVLFKQAWTGEPHSITMGKLVDEPMSALWPFLKDGPPFPPGPPDAPEVKASLPKLEKLPRMNDPKSLQLLQTGAQPCYVDSASDLPTDPDKPCSKRKQPAFNGRQAYYSSGLLPYEGETGNTFSVVVAGDTAPGTYHYYCNVHGPLMSGVVTVKSKDASVPSQSEVTRQAGREVAKYTDPMNKAFREAQAQVKQTKQNLAGVGAFSTGVNASLAEFVPKKIQAKVGEKVTWHIADGGHTISFNVPKYLPEITVARDGTARYNVQVIHPVGGPGFPTTPPSREAPPTSIKVDAGNYDGSFFLSSGLGFAPPPSGPPGSPGAGGPPLETTYSLTFTKAGTYKYACLVHPEMVGDIDVR
jgi:plastocyanin